MNLKSRNEYEVRNVRLMDIGYPFRFNDNPAKTTKSFVKSTNPFRKFFGGIIKSHKNINNLYPKNPIRNCF